MMAAYEDDYEDDAVHKPKPARAPADDDLPPAAAEALSRDWKSEPIRFPMDKCPTGTHGEDPEYEHRGEAVWIVGRPGFGLQMVGARINEANQRLAAASAMGKTSEERHLQGVLAALGQEMVEGLAGMLAAWTATGRASEPLDQPYRNPAVLAELSQQEIGWLFNLALTQSLDDDEDPKGAPSSRSRSSGRRQNPKG